MHLPLRALERQYPGWDRSREYAANKATDDAMAAAGGGRVRGQGGSVGVRFRAAVSGARGAPAAPGGGRRPA